MKKPLLLISFLYLLGACSSANLEADLRRKSAEDPKQKSEDLEEPSVDEIPDETSTEDEEEEEVAEPKVEIRASGGSGGPTGMNEVTFVDSNQLSSSYKINAPEDVATKVYGLHVHFHGDGGGGYRDFPNVETREGLIGVTVKAPNANLQWGRAQGPQHAQYAQDLIQNELVKKYNVDLDKIYFSGVSGGAYFLSGSFLPEHGLQYKTGAFLMCGGEAPRTEFKDANLLKDFRIHWQVTAGERADITQSVTRSVEAYKAALTGVNGLEPKQSIETKGAGGHCEFFELAYTPGIQMMIDTQFKIILEK